MRLRSHWRGAGAKSPWCHAHRAAGSEPATLPLFAAVGDRFGAVIGDPRGSSAVHRARLAQGPPAAGRPAGYRGGPCTGNAAGKPATAGSRAATILRRGPAAGCTTAAGPAAAGRTAGNGRPHPATGTTARAVASGYRPAATRAGGAATAGATPAAGKGTGSPATSPADRGAPPQPDAFAYRPTGCAPVTGSRPAVAGPGAQCVWRGHIVGCQSGNHVGLFASPAGPA